MARYTRMQVLGTMYETGLVPVFYHPDFDVVAQVARAIALGGGRLLEFTNRGDFAYEVFGDQANRVVEVPNVPNSIEVWQTFRDAYSKAVIFGEGDIPTFLTDTAAKVDALVAED